MPLASVTEYLKQLNAVDDSQLLTGYRFLVTSRRKSVARVAFKKKAAKKRNVSSVNRRSGAKAVSKGR
jgi:hypothetical protein